MEALKVTPTGVQMREERYGEKCSACGEWKDTVTLPLHGRHNGPYRLTICQGCLELALGAFASSPEAVPTRKRLEQEFDAWRHFRFGRGTDRPISFVDWLQQDLGDDPEWQEFCRQNREAAIKP